MSNDFNLVLPSDVEAYNPNVISEADIATMDAEEIFHFNNAGEVFETIEELFELLKSEIGYSYDINLILIEIHKLKSKSHLTAIPLL